MAPALARTGRAAAVYVLLVAAVWAVFAPALGHDFVGYDDPDYVTRNPHVREGLTGGGLAWALTAIHANNWHPLTWISHMLDVTLFGLEPSGHHATSVALHTVNTLLLFALLRRETGRMGPSAFVAAVFGVHPLHVESVAWVAERKDVLSTTFALLALSAYGSWTRRGGAARYTIVAALFAAGLASKPMIVTLPVVLLLWDVWPLRRPPETPASRLIVQKLPLVALAAISAGVTIYAQRAGAAWVSMEHLPLDARIENALVSLVRYVAGTLWPSDLAAFYPHAGNGVPAWAVFGAFALLAAASAIALVARRRHPWLAMGWAWYLVTVAPVLGVLQVGLQSRADRYTYVPMIGLLVALAWSIDEAASRSARSRRVVATLAAAAVIALGIAARRQVHVWRDGVTLWSHALQVTEGNFIAHNNLGVELDARGRHDEALAHYRAALAIRPGDRNASGNCAMALFAKGERVLGQGDPEAALALFREGLTHRPDNAAARDYVRTIEDVLRNGTPGRAR